eukprot:309082_1
MGNEDDMILIFTSGILHGLMNMVKGAVKRITSKMWRKPGQRKKKRNYYYRASICAVLLQSRAFAKHVKSRGLNHNFDPTMKIMIEVRWNTLANHLEPFTVDSNWDKIWGVVMYWMSKRTSWTEKEEEHKYSDLVGNKVLVIALFRVLDNVKIIFAFLETEKQPTMHRVLYVIDLLLNGGSIMKEGKRITLQSTVRAKVSDPAPIKIFKRLLYTYLEKKVLVNLLIEHWEAAILCPALRDVCSKYLTKYKGKRFNKHKEAIKSLKDKLTEYWNKKRQIDGNENGNVGLDNVQVRRKKKKKKKKIKGVGFCLQKKQNDSPNRNTRQTVLNELKKYLEDDDIDDETLGESFGNPIEFWLSKQNKKRYPHLHIVAINILSIPASSAAVERLFSLAGLILSNRRLSTTTANVSMICKMNRKKK